MLKYYKEAINIYSNNKAIIFLSFLASFILAPLKSNGFTVLGAGFLIIYLISGFLGIVKNIKSDKGSKAGIRALIIEASSNFPYVSLNFLEYFFILIVDFIVVLIFGILPLIIMQVKVPEEHANRMGMIMLTMVFVYRLPIFLMIYFPFVKSKEYGRMAVIKIKEVGMRYPYVWLSIFFQMFIYVIVSFVIKSKINDIILYTLIDVIGGMIFLYFIIVNFCFYYDITEKDEELSKKFDRLTYDGYFKGIKGRFLL